MAELSQQLARLLIDIVMPKSPANRFGQPGRLDFEFFRVLPPGQFATLHLDSPYS
jgi:hypothetical protein